ncbi:murein DD-endopeptidase MepM/ murein hydrolase activator NlpD [Pontibacter aydingkolensis]|uniref:LysM peptidoglycan-binding domain-containing protein n=1 Tax=Pontibacter aydingkolensis TaxID=1911536 RepID=A0ABS7CSM0_9BACT|nr:LysM peptidoglycan-binding domain-containing protein [Pontibacter aydingkolensis]MBW7466852.1 LysM peptidoglycan-binding domain-containing protein [Pontibacter aydingkolensis]
MVNTLTTSHRVIRGESLTSIARKYGLDSYAPITVANNLADNQSLKEGQTLLIPKSKESYEVTINKLEQLKLDMIRMSKEVTKGLEKDKKNFEKVNSIIDTTSDILTIAVKTTAHGFRAAKAAQGVITKMPFIKKGIEEVSEYMIDKSVETLNDNFSPQHSQKVLEYTYKTTKDKYKIAFKYAKEGLRILDIAEVILNYVSPSKLAWFYTRWAAGGESVDDTEKNIKNMIEATQNKAIANLNNKIQKLQREKNELYNNSRPITNRKLQLM